MKRRFEAIISVLFFLSQIPFVSRARLIYSRFICRILNIAVKGEDKSKEIEAGLRGFFGSFYPVFVPGRNKAKVHRRRSMM